VCRLEMIVYFYALRNSIQNKFARRSSLGIFSYEKNSGVCTTCTEDNFC
jgi:hypothetical protein